MKRLLAVLLGASLCVLSGAQSARADSTLRVGVLRWSGQAPIALKTQGAETLVRSLRGIRSLEVLSLLDLESVLGARTARTVESCPDEVCLARALASLNLDRLVLVAMDVERSRARLSVRLVETSSASARVSMRISRDLPAVDAASVSAAVIRLPPELFVDQAAQSFGRLVLDIDPDGAEVFIDGEPHGRSPIDSVELLAGVHEVKVAADRHRPASVQAEVVVGQSTTKEIELERLHSQWPLVLLGASAGVAATGLLVGISANSTASDWEDGCPSNAACMPGFTADRYATDDSSVDAKRTAANILFGTAGALAVGALITYFFDPGASE